MSINTPSQRSSHLSLVEALEREAAESPLPRERAAELVEEFVLDAAGDHLDRLLAAARTSDGPDATPGRALAVARQIAHTAKAHSELVDREVTRFLSTSAQVAATPRSEG